MTTNFDLNDAETGGGTGSLMPAGTVARAVFTIRPGGHGEGGLFKQSSKGDLMLDCEWTISEGPFARRKVWDYLLVTGSEKATAITKKTLRALVEGNYGIRPDDMSDQAKAARRINLAQLSGMTGCISVGIESEPGYEPKNVLKFVIAPGDAKFLAPGQIAPTPTAPAAAPQQGYAAPQQGGGYGGSPAPQQGYNPPASAQQSYNPPDTSFGNPPLPQTQQPAAGPKPSWA
jgi:hypothetical protein